MQYILGLDSSLAKAGYCLIQNTKEMKLESIGVWYPKSLGVKRLYEFSWSFPALFDKYDVSWCGVEEYAYAVFAGQVYGIGEAGGLVKLHFYSRQVPMLRVQATALKKFATTGGATRGKGKVTKLDVINAVNHRYEIGLTPKDDDQADAFVLACITKMFYRVWMGLDKVSDYLPHEQEVYQRLLLAKEWML